MNNWDKINAVQRVQNYIEENINEPITLHRLSQAAGYSPWYTSCIFKQLTGKTPLEYIRVLRLSRAAVKLWDDDKRIIDVALDFAFDSHEGFTRAFSDNFGITPYRYPELYGFRWAKEDGPRFQLEPWGERGYIEAKSVRPINE